MNEFDNFLRQARLLIEILRNLLILLEQGAITPKELVERVDQLWKSIWEKEFLAESWRLKHSIGASTHLPRGYRHVDCCRAGTELLALEAAVYAIAAEQFLALESTNESRKQFELASKTLERAEAFMPELKWYRRWFFPWSINAPRFVSIEDLRNTLRGIRIGLGDIGDLLKSISIEHVNQEIEVANEIVRASIFGIHESADGRLAALSVQSIKMQLVRLAGLQLEIASQPSSFAMLSARESVNVSSSVLRYAWAVLEADAKGGLEIQYQINHARTAIAHSLYFRNRRRSILVWWPAKWLMRTLRRTPAPNWAALLPQGGMLRVVRRKNLERLDNLEEQLDDNVVLLSQAQS